MEGPLEEQVLTMTCPAGLGEGDTMSIQAPDGQQMEVDIPPGVKEGEEFDIVIMGRPAALAASTTPTPDASIQHAGAESDAAVIVMSSSSDDEDGSGDDGGDDDAEDSADGQQTTASRQLEGTSGGPDADTGAGAPGLEAPAVHDAEGRQEILVRRIFACRSLLHLRARPRCCRSPTPRPACRQVTVLCPSGLSEGDTMNIAGPDGQQMEVDIPPGVTAGEEFDIVIMGRPLHQPQPPVGPASPSAQAYDELQQMLASPAPAGAATGGAGQATPPASHSSPRGPAQPAAAPPADTRLSPAPRTPAVGGSPRREADDAGYAARPSLIPSLCTHFTRAGIEWR